MKVTRQTVTSWLVSWNKRGYQGLKPEFSGGYTPRLRKQEWDQVVSQIKGKGYDIEQVSALILKQKAVHYSYEMVWYKLRKEYNTLWQALP